MVTTAVVGLVGVALAIVGALEDRQQGATCNNGRSALYWQTLGWWSRVQDAGAGS